MKRNLIYVSLVATLLLASCGTKGYKVAGTIEGAQDGDTVYVLDRQKRAFETVDTAIIKNGKFELTGVQDSAVNRYISYQGEDDMRPRYFDLFLENGEISFYMAEGEGRSYAIGTVTNDAYQGFKDQLSGAIKAQNEAYGKYLEAAPEDREALEPAVEEAQENLKTVISDNVAKHVSTELGKFLLVSYSGYISEEKLAELLPKVAEKFQNDEDILRLKAKVEAAAKTAVGQPFVDFEMKDQNGNPVKLSDYAGKGKLVLVDFWASWCPPCREEMPKLVDLYAKYKNQNFEIVGVSLDRTEDAWLKGLKDLNMTWPQMSDLKYWDCEGSKLYAVSAIPHVVLIDGNGVIVSRGLHGDELIEKVVELLK